MNDFITLKIKHLDVMKYAIGFSLDKIKNGEYEAYRNYNLTYGTDETWEYLVSQGYAIAKDFYYKVSDEGLRLLESIYDIKIIKDN